MSDETCDNCGVEVDKDPRVLCDDCEAFGEEDEAATEARVVAGIVAHLRVRWAPARAGIVKGAWDEAADFIEQGKWRKK